MDSTSSGHTSSDAALPKVIMNDPFTPVAAHCPLAPFLVAPFFWNPPAWIILLMNPPTSRLARLAFTLAHPWLLPRSVRDPRLSRDYTAPLLRASTSAPLPANDNGTDAQQREAKG